MFLESLSACYAVVQDPENIGNNSYIVSARHTAFGSGLSSHVEIRQLALDRGKKFCKDRGEVFVMTSYAGNGYAGLGPIDETVKFNCVKKTPKTLEFPPMFHQGVAEYTLAGRLLSDPWLSGFMTSSNRTPVLEAVDIKEGALEVMRYGKDQDQLIKGVKEKVIEALLESHKVRFVTTRARSFTHLERYFEMRHASADSVHQPGHLQGADFALIYRHSALPANYVGRDSRHIIAKIFFHFELIAIANDEIVWKGDEELDYDSSKGETALVSSSNPGVGPTRLALVSGKWVPLP